MRELAPKGVEINFDGYDRRFLFTLNVIDELQEEHDKPITEILKEAVDLEAKNHDMLISVVTALVNEDVEIHNEETGDNWKKVDKKYISRKITYNNLQEIILAIIDTFSSGLPKNLDKSGPTMSER